LFTSSRFNSNQEDEARRFFSHPQKQQLKRNGSQVFSWWYAEFLIGFVCIIAFPSLQCMQERTRRGHVPLELFEKTKGKERKTKGKEKKKRISERHSKPEATESV